MPVLDRSRKVVRQPIPSRACTPGRGERCHSIVATYLQLHALSTRGSEPPSAFTGQWETRLAEVVVGHVAGLQNDRRRPPGGCVDSPERRRNGPPLVGSIDYLGAWAVLDDAGQA